MEVCRGGTQTGSGGRSCRRCEVHCRSSNREPFENGDADTVARNGGAAGDDDVVVTGMTMW